MEKRSIISIDHNKCNGCGLCIPNCPEGAIQIIDNKAHLVSDLFCDGLGACIGHCPQGAITIEERPAQEYSEKKVMENIVKHGKNVILAHLKHLKDHKQNEYLKQALGYLKENNIDINIENNSDAHVHVHGGCPGSKIMDLRNYKKAEVARGVMDQASQLGQWPVQLKLVPVLAPYFENADLLIAADCVPFAYADFHQRLLKGKILLVGCPKLDDLDSYKDKITQIIKNNKIRSVVYAHMEVPCCFGLLPIIKEAIASTDKKIIFSEVNISITGEKII